MSNKQNEARLNRKSLETPALERSTNHLAVSPAVIILGPPWPRSGTGRVIQNEIAYYRNRGFFTVFVAVPFLRHFIYLQQADLMEGLNELGADRLCVATLDERKYKAAKYRASLRHAFHGTALDWRVAIGESARLSEGDVDFLSRLRPSLLHVNHIYMLRFALNLRRHLFDDGMDVPVILETHDVQSQLLHGRGIPNPWTQRPDSLERLIKAETKLMEKANVLIHLSVDDFRLFQTRIPSKPHFLAFPTIDETFSSSANAAASVAERVDLMFVGQWHVPNLEAVKWFFDKVWPLIADRRYTVRILGRVGPMVQQDLPQLYETFRSCFVGAVADLAPYYQAARCVIAPMVSGSGTSIKTIEALALGKPFVGTSKAFRGMPMDRLSSVGILAHDEPQAFADAIVHALGNEAEAQAISRAAYDEVFSVEANSAARDQALHAALNGYQRVQNANH